MSKISQDLFVNRVYDKTAATDESVMPIALGSGATIVGLGYNPAIGLLDRRSTARYRYPKAYEEFDMLTEIPLGVMERNLGASKVYDLARNLKGESAETAILRKQFELGNQVQTYGEKQLKQLEAQAANTLEGRILRGLGKVPGIRWSGVVAPIVGLGGAVYTGRQLYKRYKNRNS